MKFTTLSIDDLPPDPKDKYADAVVAFRELPPGKVLFVQPDEPMKDRRGTGAMKAALKKRLGPNVEFRVTDDGVYCWPKGLKPETRAPFSARPNAVSANGVGAR